MAELIRLIKDIWQKFGDDGPTFEEMRNAKDYINGSFALRFTNSKSIAGVLNAVQRFDLGTDYLKNRSDLINRVTLRELKRVAKRLFKAKELTFVIVGKPKNIISTMPVPMTE